MALAVLKLEEVRDDVARFQVDIGHNRYYRYQIGDREVLDGGGFALLASPVVTSQLLGPLRPAALGRTFLEIPVELFDRDSRFVQLTSFRALPDSGPAISDIVEVPLAYLPAGLPNDREPVPEPDDKPTLTERLPSFATRRERTAMQRYANSTTLSRPNKGTGTRSRSAAIDGTTQLPPTRTSYAVPFAYRETRYSDAMFLEAIGSLLSSAMPAINQVISGLGGAEGIAKVVGGLLAGGAPVGASAKGSGGAQTPASGATPQSITPELAKQIAEVIKLLATPQAAKAQSMSGYSEQMIAPAAILAALPALAPILQKVLDPQTINAILSNVGPKATLGAVADAVKDIGGLNVEAHQNILDHIQKIMPSSDTSPLLNHLLAVSVSLSAPTILPSYRRVEAVRLHFQEQPKVMLRGREQTLYRAGAAAGLAFPLVVESPRPIGQARLYLIVKDAETLRVVVERQWDVSDVGTGPLAQTPLLTAAEAAGLLPGSEYLVGVYLVWNTKRGDRIGASRSRTIRVVGDYCYQGVEAGGEVVPLNDVEAYRAFWHKVWQESFTDEIRRWTWDCKYYYILHADDGEVERLHAITDGSVEGGRRMEGRMKSGLRVGLTQLNAILPRISPHPALDAAQLQAISAPSAVASMVRAARSKVEFRGPVGESAALWVYPELRVQPIVLLRIDGTTPDGVVGALTEVRVHFPIPAAAHFVGVTTERASSPLIDYGKEL